MSDHMLKYDLLRNVIFLRKMLREPPSQYQLMEYMYGYEWDETFLAIKQVSNPKFDLENPWLQYWIKRNIYHVNPTNHGYNLFHWWRAQPHMKATTWVQDTRAGYGCGSKYETKVQRAAIPGKGK